MIKHETKEKGTIGLTKIIADVSEYGFHVALPISDHLPFDCIIISPEGKLCRLSVKYRKMVNGKENVIYCSLKTVYSNLKGNHVSSPDFKSFDAVGIYCPDTKECYYIRSGEFTGDSINLRLTRPERNIEVGIRMAADYKDPERLFF